MNKILIIVAKKSISSKIKEILEKSIPNCRVLVAHSGIEGIAVAKSELPDTIILDIVMPVMNGYEVCAKLKANEETENIPIILTSENENKIKGLKIGADAFLSKPIDSTELSAQVSLMLRIRKVKKALHESEEKFRSLFSEMSEGVFLHEVVYDKNDKAINYRIIDSNTASEKILNIKSEDAIGKLATELYRTEEAPFLELYAKVAQTGIPVKFEEYFPQMKIYFNISVYSPVKGKFATVFSDITKRKNLEKHIQHRLIALTQPEVEMGDLSLTDIIDIDILQNLQDSFADAFNMPSIIYGTKGIPITKPSCFTPFCKLVRSTKKGAAKCEIFDNELMQNLSNDHTPTIRRGCALNNMVTGTVPIVIQGKHLANWGIGQMIDQELDFEEIRNYANDIDLDNEELVSAAKTLVPVDDKVFNKAVIFLNTLSDQISILALQNLQQGRDLAKHKQIEEALKDSESNLRQIIDLVPHFIYVKDEDGKDLIVNKAVADAYGTTVENIIGKSDIDITPDQENAAKFIKDDLEVINSRKQKFIPEEQIVDSKGNIRFLETTKIPFETSITEKRAILGISVDIIERKKKEQELIVAKEKAEESDRLKTAFLHNMSHEIRTPMNGILGFTELLKNPKLTGDKHQNYLKIIETSGDRMLNTINDLMNISMIESGHEEVNISVVNINEQTKNLFSFFKPEVEKKGMKLFLNNSLPASKCITNTDCDKLYTILSNLIKNSIKYSHKGNIKFGYTKKGENLEFFIKDTGIGIPNDRKEAIFDRFVQADIDDRGVYEGSGLGLSISKAYVEMLGGRIWVESEEGIGSQFYFTIPCHNNKIKLPENEINDHDIKSVSMANDLIIYIAEDDEFAIDYFKIILNDISKELIFARNGMEIIELCKNKPNVDLILMDIKMPGMNGLEATKQIRKFNNDVIIIAQTANALMGDHEKALNAGCNDYITKPIKKEKLLSVIGKYA